MNGTGSGHGMNTGRAGSDSLRGRNVLRRQLEIKREYCPEGDPLKQGTVVLRPGLWRIIPLWPVNKFYSPIASPPFWFRLNSRVTFETPGLPPATDQAEPIPWVIGHREVFVDRECECTYSMTEGMYVVFVMLSELDEP